MTCIIHKYTKYVKYLGTGHYLWGGGGGGLQIGRGACEVLPLQKKGGGGLSHAEGGGGLKMLWGSLYVVA